MTVNRLNKSDFDKICRICLLYKRSMFCINVEETTIAIKTCLDIEIKKDDEFPKSICTDCLEKVYKYATFRELCKNSEKTLREIIGKEFQEVDNNYNGDNCNNYCTQEVLVNYTSRIKNEVEIKEEVIIKEETELEYKDGKNHLLFEFNDYDNSNLNKKIIKEACIIDIQDVKRMMKEVNRTSKKIVHCKICRKKMHESTLYEHLHRHIRGKQHKCHKCLKAYREPSDLAKHLLERHKAKADIKCEICHKMFVIQAQLDFHMRIHRKKTKTCDICGKDVIKLDRHKRTHNKSETFFCLKCDSSFLQEIYLKQHMRKYHSEKMRKKQACQRCNKVVYDIRLHTLITHSNIKSHKCNQCGKAFTTEKVLNGHIRAQHSSVQKKIEALCPICGKSWPSRGELKKHLPTHLEGRRFDCHLCDKKYKSCGGLRTHVQRVHNGIRPYICTHCAKSFATKIILENHMRTHTGERPFACHICGRNFTQTAALRTHMKIH